MVKRKAGKGLSPDSRKEQGLALTPKEENLVARQVNVLCVCAHEMADVSWLCRDIVISVNLFKRKAGRRLSPDSRKARDLELSPKEEQLVARQVNVPCVCVYVMAVVCA